MLKLFQIFSLQAFNKMNHLKEGKGMNLTKNKLYYLFSPKLKLK